MRAYSRFPVDDDVLYRVLTCLSDVNSLRAMVLSCRSVNAVWKRHSNLILFTIVRNAAGSAWRHALYAARARQFGDASGWNERDAFARSSSVVSGSAGSSESCLGTESEGDDELDGEFGEDEEGHGDQNNMDDAEEYAAVLANISTCIRSFPSEDALVYDSLTLTDATFICVFAPTVDSLEDVFSQRSGASFASC
jgi:hypothetical protein